MKPEEIAAWLEAALKEHVRAEDFLKAAASQADSEPDPAGFLAGLGVRLHGVSRLELARDTTRLALAGYEKHGSETGVGNCRRVIGAMCLLLGQFTEAIDHLSKALAIARRTGNKVLEAGSLANIGGAYCRQSMHQQALEYYQSGLEVASSLGNYQITASCHQGLGSCHYGLGQFKEAIECLKFGVEAAERAGDRRAAAGCHANLGVMYDNLGDCTRAIGHYQKALEMFVELGDKLGQAACQTNLGNASRKLGEVKEAVRHHRAALALAIDAGGRVEESRAYNNLGTDYFALRDYRTAADYYWRALDIKEKIGDKEGTSATYSNLGEAYDRLGNYERTLECYGRALEIAEEAGNVHLMARCLTELGHACFARHDFRKAERHYRTGAEVVEGMEKRHIPGEYLDRFWRDNQVLFENLVYCDVRLGKVREGVVDSERGKGRTFQDYAITRDLSDRTIAPEPLGYAGITALARRVAGGLILFRVMERGTLVFIVRADGEPEVIEFSGFTQKRLRALLLGDSDRAPLAGWLNHYQAYKFARGEPLRSGAAGESARTAGAIAESEQRWLGTMDRTLRTLHDEMLGQVFERFESGERVVLVPNRSLSILPLHACFREENGRRKYLLEDYEISYAPSCSILDLCQKREAEGRQRGRLFAVANPAPPYDLVFSEWEVEEISKWFEQKDVHVKAKAKDALLERMAECGVLHLATHGVHDLGSSFDSRLRMGEDTDLTLAETFERVRLGRSWLVCLSACESGLVDYRDIADEFVGLQTGFLYAGAPTVVASLWSITDYTTALLMMKLYRNICEQGMKKVAALREAQLWLKELTAGEALELVKAKEEVLEYSERMGREDLSPMRRQISLEEPGARPFAHPYFWAGFQAFGV